MLVAGFIAGGREALLDPGSSVWSKLEATKLPLVGTPLGTQPTSYMRSAWKDRKIGAVEAVEVRAGHDGEAIYLRLEWSDGSENRSLQGGEAFADAAAIAFPLAADTPINTMGNEQAGVNAWLWRGDLLEGRSVVAHGLGTTEPCEDVVRTGAVRSKDRWQVVISRRLAGTRLAAGAPTASTADLEPGATTRFGVAVWDGGNGERAGFKAYTESWIDLRLAES